MNIQAIIKLRANAVIRLRQQVSDLRNKGEDDPATDEFKCIAAAYEIAVENFRDIAKPEVVLALLAPDVDDDFEPPRPAEP